MTNKYRTNIPLWKIAGAATALAFAAVTLSAPTQAYSHTHRHARAHLRQSYARVYAPSPGVVNRDVVGDAPGYSCGIGLGNTPLPCEPNR